MTYDAKLHRILASGPQHSTGGADGWCEHWRTEDAPDLDPEARAQPFGGKREGDRDCVTTPAVYLFKKRKRGKVVNTFRSCEAHRAFITDVEKGWEPSGYHPDYLRANRAS